MNIGFKTTRKITLISIMLLFAGCSSLTGKDEFSANTQNTATPQSVTFPMHVAFAGGGWRAHSGHTGWVASAIDEAGSLDSAFLNIQTISSNSGGSWFSTMLSYSPAFKSALDKGRSSIWLADQKIKFGRHKTESCVIVSVLDEKTATNCILYNDFDLKWQDFISDFVLSGWFPVTPSGPPSLSSKMTWVNPKSLLLAATLLTHNVVLDGSKAGDKSYYWICNILAVPILKEEDVTDWKNDGDKGGFCNPKVNPSIHPTPPIYADTIPVTFSHVSNGAAPPFLQSLNSKLASESYNVGYTKNMFSGAPLDKAILQNPLDSSQVKVINAAAASSAAAGFVASEDVVPISTGKWEQAWIASDLALSFSLEASTVKQVVAPTSFSELHTQKIVRLADGGVVDNTGIAQLVSYLQASNPTGTFSIVAFDNYLHGYGKNGLSNELQKMLGYDNPTSGKITFQGVTIKIPDLQIFVKSSSSMPLSKASSPLILANCKNASSADALYYFNVTVKTKENKVMGIKAGATINLHLFSSSSTAPTAPVKVDNAFNCYNELLLSIKTNTIMKPYLKQALGL